MTTPGVHATIADLDNAYTGGQNVVGDVRNLITQLNGQIENMKATFIGQARGAFDAQHLEWNDQMTRLTTELDRISNAAKASADRQRQLEADSVSAVTRAAG